MKKVAISIIAVAALAASPAHASYPPPGAIMHAKRVALSYWGHTPSCGMPYVVVQPLSSAVKGAVWVHGDCRIELNSSYAWSGASEVCTAVVHEWGHLVLGPTYFAASNPSDPAHDPRPGQIMSAGGLVLFWPCAETRYYVGPWESSVRHSHRQRP